MVRIPILVLLLSKTTLVRCDCPSQCQCSDYVVKCSNRGLKRVPEDIPITARKVDLSNNPSLNVSREYFLRFHYLFILLLDNCGLQRPIYLPRSVRDVRLENNALGAMTLRQMFSNKTKLLRRISLENNGLQTSDVKQVLKFLPPKLEQINLNSNNITKLTKNDFRRFNNLKIVRLRNCSLKSIEPCVFDNLMQLSRLRIDDSDLKELPDGLFKRNVKLNYLNIAGNKLTQFNATKLGLRKVLQIDLGYNSLTTIDVQTLTTRKIWLNNNRLQKLESQLFHNNSFLSHIVLSSNSLQSISSNTFNNIHYIGELSLKFNSLTSLPKGIFSHVTVMKILLQRNSLQDVEGVFDGINSFMHVIGLTENTGLRTIQGSDFAALGSKSTVFLTCTDLVKITNPSKIRAKILCSPKADLVIHTTNTNGMSCTGYSCTLNQMRPLYTCRACKQGYFSVCRNIREANSTCVQCPAGSYYQDGPASVRCKTCKPGQFVPPERSPGKDASDCETCPQGTNTNKVAGTRACKCLHGYTRTYRFGPCKKCTDIGYNCIQDYQVLRHGFWMTWQGTAPDYNLTVDKKQFLQSTCEPNYKAFIKNLDVTDDSYNRATMHFNCQMPLPIKCPMAGSCVGGIKPTCSTGYTGVLCAVCRQGYNHQFNQCIPCPQSHWATIQFIGYIVLFAIFCFILSVTDKIIVEDAATPIQTAQPTDRRTVADILLSSLKILIGFYQILMSIMDALSCVHWSQDLKTAASILQNLDFQIISFSSLYCITPEWKLDAIIEFWIILLIVIIPPVLATSYYFVKSVYIHCRRLSPTVAIKIRH